MSKETKRKFIARKVQLDDYEPPKENQEIVKVLGGRGSNLHEVISAENEKFLVSMPCKFRRHVWIRRGSYVVVERIAEGNKVKAEIVQVLLADHIKDLKQEDKWPSCFSDAAPEPEVSDEERDDDDEDDLPPNPNRPTVTYSSSSEEEEDSEGDDIDQ